MKKWEYYTVVKTNETVHTSEVLNPLGKEGWELVAYDNTVGNSPQTIFILKRELHKQEE